MKLATILLHIYARGFRCESAMIGATCGHVMELKSNAEVVVVGGSVGTDRNGDFKNICCCSIFFSHVDSLVLGCTQWRSNVLYRTPAYFAGLQPMPPTLAIVHVYVMWHGALSLHWNAEETWWCFPVHSRHGFEAHSVVRKERILIIGQYFRTVLSNSYNDNQVNYKIKTFNYYIFFQKLQ